MTDEPCFRVYDAGSCSVAVRILLAEGGFSCRAYRGSARDADRDTRRLD